MAGHLKKKRKKKRVGSHTPAHRRQQQVKKLRKLGKQAFAGPFEPAGEPLSEPELLKIAAERRKRQSKIKRFVPGPFRGPRGSRSL